MKSRIMKNNVSWYGAIDWDRRIFDSLLPLPDGTSYNSYLVTGSEKVALMDSVDTAFSDELMTQLQDVPKIDYIVSHHSEQDHSGSIPLVLAKYPEAKVVTTKRGKAMLEAHLKIIEEKFIVVGDGEELSLGDKNLTFIHTPWVHWPETMVTYLHEDKILFTCDFFGTHIATSDLYVTDESRVLEAAKRYFAEIMMPLKDHIAKNLEKLEELDIEMIAPGHGPVYKNPKLIIDAYGDWVHGEPKNIAVLPYVSMHGSTKEMINYLAESLIEKGVTVEIFDLAVSDIGKLASALVDAKTIVVGTPTVLTGPHPHAAYAAFLTNLLKPPAKYISVLGSYGWGGKVVEQLASFLPNLKVEVLTPVLSKGVLEPSDFEAIEVLAETIAQKHNEA